MVVGVSLLVFVIIIIYVIQKTHSKTIHQRYTVILIGYFIRKTYTISMERFMYTIEFKKCQLLPNHFHYIIFIFILYTYFAVFFFRRHLIKKDWIHYTLPPTHKNKQTNKPIQNRWLCSLSSKCIDWRTHKKWFYSSKLFANSLPCKTFP